jgi:hypothetical protein
MLLADQAFNMTFGLAITFLGIGVIVNIILIYIAIQVRGERRQNEQQLNSRRPPEA